MIVEEVKLNEAVLAQLISLSSDWEKENASKNFRAILHFYIDELGMEFWSARLFKRIR